MSNADTGANGVSVTPGVSTTSTIEYLMRSSLYLAEESVSEGSTGFGVLRTTAGVHVEYTKQSGDSLVRFYGNLIGQSFVVDNISIREIKGYHAYQTTPTARPTLSGRYNICEHTDDFGNAWWANIARGAGKAPAVTSNAAIAPDGSLTADKVVFDITGWASAVDHSVISKEVKVPPLGAVCTASVWLRADEPCLLVARYPQNTGAYAALWVTTEWKRFEWKGKVPSTSHERFEFGLRPTIIDEYTGVTLPVPNIATVYAWGLTSEQPTMV